MTFIGENEVNAEVITVSPNQTSNITFSNAGKLATLLITNNSEEDDSFSDLFGAASHITLLLLVSLLTVGRRVNFSKKYF